MKKCKVCGEQNPSENKFCINCGMTDFEVSPVQELTCARCGTKCDAIFSHCINCGGLLDKTPVSVLTEQQPVVDIQEPLQQDTVFTNAVDVVAPNAATVSPAAETFSCPFCGGNVALHDIFCPECGKDITKYNLHKVVKRKVCKFCGKPNLMSANYCSYCFFDLSDADVDDFQLGYKQQANDTKQAYLQSATSHRQKICSNCGTMNDEKDDFCVKCGLQLFVDVPKTYCFVCGQENLPDATFCTACRYPLSGKNAAEIEHGWKCSCGSFNKKDDMFCSECGRSKQQAIPTIAEETL